MTRHTRDRGLYETLITEALDAHLTTLDPALTAQRAPLHEAEAADRIALHLSRVLERALASLDKRQRVEVGTALARQLVDLIVQATDTAALTPERPTAPAHMLHSILGTLPDGSAEPIPQPLIPLLDTTLLTNAPGEPRVGKQVLTEVHSADRIDVVMAFIRRTGIARTWPLEHGNPKRSARCPPRMHPRPPARSDVRSLGATSRRPAQATPSAPPPTHRPRRNPRPTRSKPHRPPAACPRPSAGTPAPPSGQARRTAPVRPRCTRAS
jgi:hypothetical protein